MNCIVLSAQKWNFTDDGTGEVREGVSVWYAGGDSFSPVQMTDDRKGFELLKATLPVGSYGSFTEVPGLYDVDMRLVSRKNEAVMRPVGFRFVKSFALPKELRGGEGRQ